MKYKLPEGWGKSSLGEVARFKNGKKAESIKNINKDQYPLYGGNGQYGSVNSYNAEDSLVIGRVGAYCGSVHKVKGRFWISDNAIEAGPIDEDILSSSYLFYRLKSFNLNSLHQGTSQPLLNQSILKNIEFMIPKLPEQKAIADTLSSIDNKIELNNKMNKNLEEQAQAIFNHWFINFEFPDENGTPYRSSGGEMIESELGMIPKGWEVCNLIDEIDITYGAPFKSKKFNEEGVGYPLIRIRDLKTFTPQHFTDEKHPKREFIETGDILAGMDGEFMPYIWLGPRSVLNQRVCKFESIEKNKYDNLYIYLLIKPKLLHIESYKTGTTVIHLGKRDIDSIKKIKPDERVVKEFSNISYKFWNKIINLAKEKIVLNKLRDTLLPKLMSGELRIPLD